MLTLGALLPLVPGCLLSEKIECLDPDGCTLPPYKPADMRVSVFVSDSQVVQDGPVTITLSFVNKKDRPIEMPDQYCEFGNLTLSYVARGTTTPVAVNTSNELCAGIAIPARSLKPGDSVMAIRSFNKALNVARHTMGPGRYLLQGEVFLGHNKVAGNTSGRIFSQRTTELSVLPRP